MTGDIPMFARSFTGAKRTARVEARVTDETKFDLAKRCHEIGVTESDYVQQLIEISLYGFEHVTSVQAARLRLVCGSYGLASDGEPK